MAEEDGKLHFTLIRKKRKQNKKMLLMKTANAYLIMIDWLFQDNLSQKMREKKQMTYFYYHHCLCAFFFHHSAALLRLPVIFFIFFYWLALVHAKPAQIQAKSSAERWESTRHRFVRSPSESQTRTDNINCFPRLWELSARRHTNALNAKACLVLSTIVGFKSTGVAWKVALLLIVIQVQDSFFSF